MRGLNVYCCPSCGHYGFFQLVANAVCPHCSIAMTPLPIPYQDFMDLDYSQRQVLISRHMLNAALSSDTSEPFVSPPQIPSNTNSRNKAVSSDKSDSVDKHKSFGKIQSSHNSKSLNKAKSADKANSSPRTRSVGSTASSNGTALADSTVLPEDANTPAPPASASSKIHPEISEASDKEALYQEVLALREKNAQLEQTISWMHDLIWELTRRLHITQNT